MNILTPTESLSKAYLKINPVRNEFDKFISSLTNLFNTPINESEEFFKNIVSSFLKNSYYNDKYFINTRDRIDLVIHTGKDANTPVGVILEMKRPSNYNEMPTKENINTKATQELLLYYLRERIDNEGKFRNNEIKNLIITNRDKWFIFDATEFEKSFINDKKLVKQYIEFANNRLAINTTDKFYSEIASFYIEQHKNEIKFTYFELDNIYNDYQNKKNEKVLIPIFKLLSPEHLLKLPFQNDSNTLNTAFYNELLHIIGLEEITDSGKKLIVRKKDKNRDVGSLLENAIAEIENNGRLKSQYGYFPSQIKYEQMLFEKALELCITWVNRVLFLKLLEAQLVSFNSNDSGYKFLTIEIINNYNNLNRLFFDVLAKKIEERNTEFSRRLNYIPYLNSSLFEESLIENKLININSLDSELKLKIYSNTVLKDNRSNKISGAKNTLEYLFEFLDAYNFSSAESGEQIEEQSKTIINASVLGLIFEKINGYKDGSFFTPGFVTMYMSKETIRKAVVDKFKKEVNNEIENFDELRNFLANKFKNEDILKYNQIINSITICDPAVGSGHFLVSALNEMIAIKSELNILADDKGEKLPIEIIIENDELLIIWNNSFYSYDFQFEKNAKIQKAIFHEKQNIIENCLFGVDINPNSVKICQLRLWIELLKNTYYDGNHQLVTLPNIDINIRCGNSLISKYNIDDNLSMFSNQSKNKINEYKLAVYTYKNTQEKEQKKELENLINKIKEDFKAEFITNNIDKDKLDKLLISYGDFVKERLTDIEDKTKVSKADKSRLEKLSKEIEILKSKIEDKQNNRIYDNAFEWRFEFPEVLDEDGTFKGFDIIIGNPPYIQLQRNEGILADGLENQNYQTFARTGDIYSLFYEKGYYLLKNDGYLHFITSNSWMRAGYGKSTRFFLSDKTNPILLIDFNGYKVFDNATVDTNLLMYQKSDNIGKTIICQVEDNFDENIEKSVKENSFIKNFNSSKAWVISNDIENRIKDKIENKGIPLKELDIKIYRGVLTGFNEAFIIDGKKKDELIAEDTKSAEIIKPILRGRDIKRYKSEFADLWLINSHNGVRGIFDRIDVVNDYPAIYKHLLKYEIQLKKRQDKGNHWTNLRNCAYLEEFIKEKIVYPETTLLNNFYYDKSSYIIEKTGFILVGKNLKFIISILNSKFFFNLYKKYYSSVVLGKKGFQYNKFSFEKIPIPKLSIEAQEPFIDLVDVILSKKEKGQDTKAEEAQIDLMVYDLYELTEEEIKIVEGV